MKAYRFTGVPLVLIILALLIGATVLWLYNQSGFFTKEVKNVVLISIDTCRADHLSCYGYARQTTPNIDQLSQEGILFTNAYTPVPMTLPAHCSMLTGTIPPYHGVHVNGGYTLGRSNVTLAEMLHRNGFTTCAIISSFVLDSQFGLGRGFEYYNDDFDKSSEKWTDYNRRCSSDQREGDEVSRLALEWLNRHRSDRFFLFLHYYDPHTMYVPPEPFASRFSDNLYAGEIAYTDSCIGQVIKKLKDLGLYESALIIITSDHGEMLAEHGEDTHGYFIYQSVLKVPLIIKLPGQYKAGKTDDPVGIIDIVPTVCGILGIQTPPGIHGKDLSSYFASSRPDGKDRLIYCESLVPTKYFANSLLGVVNSRWKYIQTTRPELYDIVLDPGEANNQLKQQPRQARVLQDRLKQVLEESVCEEGSENKAELDEEGRKRLESLGYLAGISVSEGLGFDQSKEDPKDLIAYHALCVKAAELICIEKYAQAKEMCEQVLKERPQVVFAYFNLARIAREQNDFSGVVRYLTEIVRLKPDDVEQRIELGNAFLELDRIDEAEGQYRAVLRIDPGQAKAYSNIGVILSKQGRLTEAISYFSKALEIDPSFAEAYNNLNIITARQRMFSEAGDDTKVGFAGKGIKEE